MRKSLLSMFFLVTSVCSAGDYQLDWIIKGKGIKSQFKTKIETKQFQQSITSVYPQGFSFSRIKTGIVNENFDAMFLTNANFPVIITPGTGSTIIMGYNQTQVQAHSLLYLLVNALQTFQGKGQTLTFAGMRIALSLFPVLTLPHGTPSLEQSFSGGLVVDHDIVYGDLYSHTAFNDGTLVEDVHHNSYGIMLHQVNGGFQLTLTFDRIGPQPVNQVLTAISNGSYSGGFISGFIPAEIMDVLITPPQGAATMTNPATQVTVAGALAATVLVHNSKK